MDTTVLFTHLKMRVAFSNYAWNMNNKSNTYNHAYRCAQQNGIG